MQDERDDDREQDEQEEGQDSPKPDRFDDFNDLDDGTPFRAWELQIHAIETIGEIYIKLASFDVEEIAEVTRAVGHSLRDLVEDHKPRNIAIMASYVAANQGTGPGE